MSKFPVFPMWVKDYLADTSHLDATHHGVYHLLLYRYWLMDGRALTEDLTFLKQVAKCRKLSTIEQILNEFWDHEPGVGYHHRRATLQLRVARDRSSVQREKAKKRWKINDHSHANASPRQCPPDPDPDPDPDLKSSVLLSSESTPIAESKPTLSGRSVKVHCAKNDQPQKWLEEAKNPPDKPAPHSPKAAHGTNEYSDDFEQAWKTRPRRGGSDPKSRAYRAWKARLKNGHEPDAMRAGLERYRVFCEKTDKIGTEYVMQTATFFGPSDPPQFSESWHVQKCTVGPESNIERLKREMPEWFGGGVTIDGEVEK